MATVGSDFAPYEAWMDRCGIARDHIRVLDDTYTAQAYITTDQDDNQITAFHPGAMNESHRCRVDKVDGVTLGLVSPDGMLGMIQHAKLFAEAGVPFIFDPGQAMPLFNGDDLNRFAEQASYLAFNDYEAKLMAERTGKSIEQLAANAKALIVTRGGEGSLIYAEGRVIEIPAAPVAQLADPTGCGDAYRAGLIYGLQHGMDWETIGRVAGLMGAIKIEHAGTQNHGFNKDEFEARFRDAYGRSL
jgi:adenosine kinase